VFEVEVENRSLPGVIAFLVLGHQDFKSGEAVFMDRRIEQARDILKGKVRVAPRDSALDRNADTNKAVAVPILPLSVLKNQARFRARAGSAAAPSSFLRLARVNGILMDAAAFHSGSRMGEKNRRVRGHAHLRARDREKKGQDAPHHPASIPTVEYTPHIWKRFKSSSIPSSGKPPIVLPSARR
jgi:hypothetical protein